MENIIPEWERKIDESREKHKHAKIVSDIDELIDKKTKYCEECDLFYYE